MKDTDALTSLEKRIARPFILRFLFGLVPALAVLLASAYLQVLSQYAAAALSAGATVVGMYALWRPQPWLGLKSRWASAGLIAIASLLAFAILANQRLAELRASNPDAYLTTIRERDPNLWLAELQLLRPDLYAQEMKRRAEEKIAHEASQHASAEMRETAERDKIARKASEAAAEEARRNAEAEQREARIQEAARAPNFKCEVGRPTFSDIVDVKGTGTELRVGPSARAARIINKRATEVLGETHYISVNSNSRVQVQCEQGDWVRIQILAPDMFAHVAGWVRRKILAVPRLAGEPRVFTADDIYWDKGTAPYKKAILKEINRLSKEVPPCTTDLNTGTVTKSSSKSEPGYPVFFVTCGSGLTIVNMFFRP